jgi:hypothetical protein
MATARGTLCIPDKPVVAVNDISWVGEPTENPKVGVRSLVIGLSGEGAKKLAAITEIYHGEELVLVLDNKAVFILKIDRTIVSGEIALKESLKGSLLDYTYEILKQALSQ